MEEGQIQKAVVKYEPEGEVQEEMDQLCTRGYEQVRLPVRKY